MMYVCDPSCIPSGDVESVILALDSQVRSVLMAMCNFKYYLNYKVEGVYSHIADEERLT